LKPVLSLFSGAGLLDRGFEQSGFCVVSAGDILWGRDVRDFSPPSHIFSGVIGGSPCQDFSKARRCAPTGLGLELLKEFARCVTQAQPDWFLLENVPAVPNCDVPGYRVQRFNLNARECGVAQNRLRCFQFGNRTGKPLVIDRGEKIADASRCCMATEGKRGDRRDFADFCELQGLPRTFDLPGLSQRMKYKLVGNGVPVPMARVVATAIKVWSVTDDDSLESWRRVCSCQCGRLVRAGQTLATAACRKRMQRKRDAAGVTGPGVVTPALSL
jgi:DNA (cytosine-5)-methyltransferase 1